MYIKVVVVVILVEQKKRDINEINFIRNDSVLSWLLLVKHHSYTVSHIILTYKHICASFSRVLQVTFYSHTKLNGIIPAKLYSN